MDCQSKCRTYVKHNWITNFMSYHLGPDEEDLELYFPPYLVDIEDDLDLDLDLPTPPRPTSPMEILDIFIPYSPDHNDDEWMSVDLSVDPFTLTITQTTPPRFVMVHTIVSLWYNQASSFRNGSHNCFLVVQSGCILYSVSFGTWHRYSPTHCIRHFSPCPFWFSYNDIYFMTFRYVIPLIQV